MFDIRTADLRRLNSLTKYPSIETYHKLGDRGRLTSEVQVDFTGSTVYATEKVDGTNARMIFCPDASFLIGSREELLYARGDLIGDPTMGIADALKETAERLLPKVACPTMLTVVYGEVYGGNIGKNAKQYSGTGAFGFRMFDLLCLRDYEYLLGQAPEEIARWRDGGGQKFGLWDAVLGFGRDHGLEVVPTLQVIEEGGVPTTLEGTYEMLQNTLKETSCRLDHEGKGKPEGLVLRNMDRTRIAKARFEDYERTLKR